MLAMSRFHELYYDHEHIIRSNYREEAKAQTVWVVADDEQLPHLKREFPDRVFVTEKWWLFQEAAIKKAQEML